MSQWTIDVQGQMYGPYSRSQLDELRDRGWLQPGFPLRDQQTGRVMRAEQIPGLFRAKPANRPTQPPPNAGRTPSVMAEDEVVVTGNRGNAELMIEKGPLLKLVVVLVLGGGMFLLWSAVVDNHNDQLEETVRAMENQEAMYHQLEAMERAMEASRPQINPDDIRHAYGQ